MWNIKIHTDSNHMTTGTTCLDEAQNRKMNSSGEISSPVPFPGNPMPGDGIVVGFRSKVFWLPGGLPSTFPDGFIGGVPIFLPSSGLSWTFVPGYSCGYSAGFPPASLVNPREIY